MTGRTIQGFFPTGRAKMLTPQVQPGAGAHTPSKPGTPAFAGRAAVAPVAQAYGGSGSFQVDPGQLGLANGGGRPLPEAVRGKMEAAFGADFSAVRVHIGPQAERIGALAFTTGTDIYFAPGRYQPDSAQGQQLLGHELTHVVQQRQGRVRGPGGGGVAVVQDMALEAEADRLGQRAAVQAKMLGAAVQAKPLGAMVQPKMPMGSFAPVGVNQSGYSTQTPIGGAGAAQRQVAVGGSRTLQPKGAKLLTALAQPRVFKGPEVLTQKAIVDELERLVRTEPFPKLFGEPIGLMCLGGIQLPEDLEVTNETLIAAARLTEIPNPSVRNCYQFIKDEDALKALIVRNTISTMITAGQIEYLRTSGLSHSVVIWVEIHYYRDRAQTTSNFHKDTLGQTLFVNLNYVTDHEIAGPEYVVNPLPVADHERNIERSLPPRFVKHLAKARGRLALPTEIKVATIPANGVVSFVDELIHHMTPVYGHRKVTGASLAKFLKKAFPIKYANALTGYEQYQKSWFIYYGPASLGSWLFSGFASVAESRKWYRWIEMTKSVSKFDRVQLLANGFSGAMADELVDEYDEHSETGSGFREVSIPHPGHPSIKGPVRLAEAPRLTRQMSSKALLNTLPQQVTGVRRFFRTWVRALPR